jgi:hypothetical protein
MHSKDDTTYFRVEDHSDGLFPIGRLIQVDATEPVGMPHNRDTGAVLDISDEGVASPWNDQINVLIELE